MVLFVARVVRLLPAFLLVGAVVVQAQSAPHVAPRFAPQFNVTLGTIRNLQYSGSLSGYAFYPEFEVSTGFLRSDRQHLSLAGGIYAGGWRDGVGEPEGCKDCVTYSHRGLVLGIRGALGLEQFLVPLSLRVGVARHVAFARYIGGSGVIGDEGADHREGYTTFETGIRAMIPVGGPLRVGGDAGVFWRASAPTGSPHAVRPAFGLAITYISGESD